MASGTVFSDTQLGRFGNLILNHYNLQLSNNPDPDQQAAHLIASDGSLPHPRPTTQEILRLKGMSDYDHDYKWQQWAGIFGNILKKYPSLSPLTPQCLSRRDGWG